MGQGNKRWIIRDASGHIDGPFTTEKILYKIGRGEFSGDEHIAHYPDGKWIPISHDPQFYDKLLEVLSADERVERSEDTRVLEFTRAQETAKNPIEPEQPPQDDIPTSEHSAESPVEENTFVPQELGDVHRSDRVKKKKRKKKAEDIELVDVRPQFIKELVQRAKLPIFAMIVIGVVGSLMWISNPTNEERIHLIAPQRNQPQVDPKTLAGIVRQGGMDFAGDTLQGYLRAQNGFVAAIEKDSKNAELLAALCMTYLRLWPYAYQDSQDAKVIATVVQWSSQIDPAGVHSATCRAMDLIVRSRYQEAKSLVEAVLDSQNQGRPPVAFYFLKGYLLEETGEHASAINYLQSAQQLSPYWILPYVIEAQAQAKQEKYGNAATIYRKVLAANPAHTVSRIELGLLEYKHFNHFDQGETLLKQGLDKDDVPKSTQSRGYFGLAEIRLKRGDQNGALEYAQKAYSLNSSNGSAKNLIVQIGGIDKVPTKVKGQQLLFEGDQFFREGDCHAAQAHYKAAFEQDQKNATAAMKAAQCLWKMSFSTESIEWLNRAIRADPKLIEAYVLLADYQSQRYNFLAAARVLESARAANPKSHEVFRGFAMVELKRNNAKGAINFGKQALLFYENDVETNIIMAQASLLLRDPKMAYNYAAKAVDLDVNHRKAQIVYAESLAGLQGVDVGLDHMLKLVNNYPLVTEYRLALGRMLLADERYQQAEEVFRQILRLEENKSKDAYVELAKVLKADGRMGEALDLLLKAAVLDPADAEPLYLAGNIYLDLKKPQEASVQFQRVITINKLFPLVHYQLGRASMQMNDAKAALNFAELEKRSNPNLADAFLLAAEAHSQLGQFSMCAGEYQRAIKLRPQQALIYVKVAQCYRKSGSLDTSMAMLNMAASKESGLAEIYKEMGAIYESKGDVVHAIEAYNQYFVLDPDASDRSQIEARISALQRGQRL